MTLWEELEEHLFDHELHRTSFTARELADQMGVSDGSRYISAYLSAQRSQKATTLYILSRTGRTRSAIWHVGARTRDAQRIGKMFADDTYRKFERAVAPDLRELAMRNPRALPVVEATMAHIKVNLELLEKQLV